MRWTNGGLVILLTVGTCLVAPSWAYGDKNHNGNGNGNHNAFSIRSPTHNEGRQIVSNANAGVASSTRNAVCKKVRVCHIHQQAW
jgi:hypothetical protein